MVPTIGDCGEDVSHCEPRSCRHTGEPLKFNRMACNKATACNISKAKEHVYGALCHRNEKVLMGFSAAQASMVHFITTLHWHTSRGPAACCNPTWGGGGGYGLVVFAVQCYEYIYLFIFYPALSQRTVGNKLQRNFGGIVSSSMQYCLG